MNVKTSALYDKNFNLCFASQILLFCSFAICLSKAVAESGESGQFKTLSRENRENGG